MALLTGLTADGTEVPVQVKPDGKLVAEGLTGPVGGVGPVGPQGPAGPQGAPAAISGTETVPGLSVVGSPKSGIFSPDADEIAISTNGRGRLFIDESGKISCNSTTGTRLEIINSTETGGGGENLHSYTSGYYIWGIRNETNALTLESNFDGAIIFKASNNGVASLPGTATERMRLTSSGRLGLGTSAPRTLLHVSGAVSANDGYEIQSPDGSWWAIAVSDTGVLSASKV